MNVCPTLLAAGELGTLREFLKHSLTGAAVDDETVRSCVATVWDQWGWKEEDGLCHSTFATFILVVRGLLALVEEDTPSSRDALREWLPASKELLRIAEYEWVWRALPTGAGHPALLLARLHGERLGCWETAVTAAEGVLRIEEFHASLRTEACRLLGRAHYALGARVAAYEAVERAIAEAAKAKYVWFEMLSLRDLLSWKAAETEAVQSRLHSVQERIEQMSSAGTEM